MTPEREARALEIACLAMTEPGDVAEFGVYLGDFAEMLLEIMPTGKTLHLYDSFMGLPDPRPGIDGSQIREGEFAADLETITKRFNGERVKVHAGWFCDINPWACEKFCFAHIDADLYQSTLSALEICRVALAQNGVILVDDCGSRQYPGVLTAVKIFRVYNAAWSLEQLPGHAILRRQE